MMNRPSAYWAIVPAAGLGRRMQSERPKQYLPLMGKTLIEHSIAPLLDLPLAGLVVAIHPEDSIWPQLSLSRDKHIETVAGGEERHHSVLNALHAIEGRADDQDWVLVHDAVRACVSAACIQRLVSQLADHPVGGLLGYPLSDTLKKVDENQVVQETIDRSAIWAALTPQMFRFGVLMKAMSHLSNSEAKRESKPTDEAMAVENMGLHPQMVEGRRDNIKVTLPGDLELAALVLQARAQQLQSLKPQAQQPQAQQSEDPQTMLLRSSNSQSQESS